MGRKITDLIADSHDGYESDADDQGFLSHQEVKDSTAPQEQQFRDFHYTSTSLPFGQLITLDSINGPSYVTAQSLVQQVAFTLSDKVFTYSPETFDLDLSLQQWQQVGNKNGFGYETSVSPMETRTGAGSAALGYMFSKDFNVSKRHIPQTIVASAATLTALRPTLDELSLLYSVASPTVAHIAAVDYVTSSSSFLTNYVSPMAEADELGLGLVSSTSTYEIQHMSLFATLLANHLPSVHVYDGIRIGRETLRVIDVLGQTGLFNAYQNITKEVHTSRKTLTLEGKVTRLLDAFNSELGTDYKPFEYYGHAKPETVFVVFGSVESSLASQVAQMLSDDGNKVGVIIVRIYRPFFEDVFLQTIPQSTKTITVLGQVSDDFQVEDSAEHSRLFKDVLAASSFSPLASQVTIRDQKYSRAEIWTPSKMSALLQQKSEKNLANAPSFKSLEKWSQIDILGSSVEQYTFWDADDSVSVNAPAIIGKLLSEDYTGNVSIHTTNDNLSQGGTSRVDIRCSPKSIDAPFSSTSAKVVFVGTEKLLESFDILENAQDDAIVVVRLPGTKGQELEKLEKKLAPTFRSKIAKKNCQLWLLDPHASSQFTDKPQYESLVTQLAFLQIISAANSASLSKLGRLSKLAEINGDPQLFRTLVADSDLALWQLNVPESWAEAVSQDGGLDVPSDLSMNSFTGFDKTENEPEGCLKSWITTVAKGFVFAEATGMQKSLRPDLAVKTATVHVKERRRLTPLLYERNIFHIEFDLGSTGLKYEIGEALGIHAENDKAQVEQFIEWYGLEPEDIVEVPSREDPSVLENRTVYQALLQNIDIFGRPPKRFYEALAEFADDEKERKELMTLGGSEGATEFKRRAEVDTTTFADVLLEFPSAHPSFHDVVRIVSPMKRREYSIASSQKVTPNSVSLLIVTVNWVDPQGRDRFGQATRFLNSLQIGAPVTVSVKPSVMKLPTKSTAPLIMAGLGTGLAPFRAFVQERAWQKQQGMDIGSVLLYMGSRHQREEYLYGEEWEAYQDAGIITLLGRAFSRDQPNKIYIQDRMRETMADIRKAYLEEEGSFYLCGPTWPVPNVTEVLEEAIESEAKAAGKKVDSHKEIEKLKDDLRYVLEVY